MKRCSLIICLSLMLICLGAVPGPACTTFVLDDGNRHITGHNYDWHLADCLLLVNPQGLQKTAFEPAWEKGRPHGWTAKYGSVTFNQYGREFPSGGMNRAGLVIEVMALSATQYPPPDNKPYVGSISQLKQYLLDTCATVGEALTACKKIRASANQNTFGVHLLLSDQKGDCAVIEFLGGKFVAHSGDTLPVKALTNNTYRESLAVWQKKEPREWGMPGNSLGRFIIAANMVTGFSSSRHGPPVDYAFEILSRTASPGYTVWSIVYDQKNMRMAFFTKANRKMRSLDLKKLNFSCVKPALVMDANADLSGDITEKLKPYTPEINRRLVQGSFQQTSFLRSISQEVRDQLAGFPEKAKCGP